MIRLAAIGSATLLSLALAFSGPGPARLMGSDEASQIRGGASTSYCYYISTLDCPRGGGTDCNSVVCDYLPPPIDAYQCPPGTPGWTAQNSLSFTRCMQDPIGYYANCTEAPLTCTTRYTCNGCIPGARLVFYCDNTAPFRTQRTFATGSGVCTSS